MKKLVFLFVVLVLLFAVKASAYFGGGPFGAVRTRAAASSSGTSILLETGDDLLLESGGFLLLE